MDVSECGMVWMYVVLTCTTMDITGLVNVIWSCTMNVEAFSECSMV